MNQERVASDGATVNLRHIFSLKLPNKYLDRTSAKAVLHKRIIKEKRMRKEKKNIFPLIKCWIILKRLNEILDLVDARRHRSNKTKQTSHLGKVCY